MTRAPSVSLAVNVVLSLAVTVLFAGSLEAVARWRERRNPPPAVADYLWDWEQKWEGDFYTIRSDVNGWPPWEKFNQDGMRDRTHPVTRPARVRRVVFLGDSVTLGDHVEPEEAFPQALQARLDAAGRPGEILSVALWGWSTRQERRAWEQVARKYAPDDVVLAVCLNDIPELQNNLTRPPSWLGALHQQSAVVRAVVDAPGREIQSVEQLFSDAQAPKVREAYQRFFGEVRGLRDSVRAQGASFSVVVFPFRFQVTAGAPAPVAQETIASFCRSESIPCLDLLPALRPLGASGFVDYDHLSPRGAQAVAQVLAGPSLLPWPPSHDEVLRAAGVAAGAHGWRSALAHADPAVRRAAAAVATIGRAPEMPSALALVPLLGDADSAVRREAAVGLGRLRSSADEIRAALFRAAGQDTDETVRWAAARALFDLGLHGADVPRLAALASHPDPYVRGFAAFSLGTLGESAASAVPALAGALRFDDAYTRGGAATALAKMGPAARDAVPALVLSLEDTNGDRRWKAARTLGRIGAPAQAAVPLLVAALADPNEYVRAHAARALGRIAPDAPDARNALQRASKDPEETVRVEARAALRQPGRP
jgi:HEAT repeat protein/lysophospholipase L1-like esterase